MEANDIMSVKSSIFTGLFLVLLLHVSISCAESVPAADTENCLLCHRYPRIGRFDKDGTKRVFYVNNRLFAESTHASVACKNCHVGLDKIPHTDIKKIDCSTKCHIDEPSTKEEFSHINVIKIHEASAHGAEAERKLKSFREDLPTCKYCHNNRILNPPGDKWSKGEPLFNEATGRCLGCHTKDQWAERFYSHVSHRMRRRRTPGEIVKLCASCHEDHEMMSRHGLMTIEAYRETFHWVQVKYGVENAPDCLSCHVPVGYAKHDIRITADPLSPINEANRVNTCRHQGGVQICHPDADAKFVAGRQHAFGMKPAVTPEGRKNMIYWAERVRSKTQHLQRLATAGISEKDIFQDKILALVSLFYKILIANVIGFMFLHQVLDYVRTKKNQRRHQVKPFSKGH